jgi:hypothetical protein
VKKLSLFFLFFSSLSTASSARAQEPPADPAPPGATAAYPQPQAGPPTPQVDPQPQGEPAPEFDTAATSPKHDARVEMWRLEMGYRGSFVTSPGFDPFSTNDFLPQFSISASRTVVASGPVSFAAGLAWDYGSSGATARGDATSLSTHRLTVPLEGRVHFARRRGAARRGGRLLVPGRADQEPLALRDGRERGLRVARLAAAGSKPSPEALAASGRRIRLGGRRAARFVAGARVGRYARGERDRLGLGHDERGVLPGGGGDQLLEPGDQLLEVRGARRTIAAGLGGARFRSRRSRWHPPHAGSWGRRRSTARLRRRAGSAPPRSIRGDRRRRRPRPAGRPPSRRERPAHPPAEQRVLLPRRPPKRSRVRRSRRQCRVEPRRIPDRRPPRGRREPFSPGSPGSARPDG